MHVCLHAHLILLVFSLKKETQFFWPLWISLLLGSWHGHSVGFCHVSHVLKISISRWFTRMSLERRLQNLHIIQAWSRSQSICKFKDMYKKKPKKTPLPFLIYYICTLIHSIFSLFLFLWLQEFHISPTFQRLLSNQNFVSIFILNSKIQTALPQPPFPQPVPARNIATSMHNFLQAA